MLSILKIEGVAHVAELVDAADSKSAIRKGVKVRFLSWAQQKTLQILQGFLFINILLQPLFIQYNHFFFFTAYYFVVKH